MSLINIFTNSAPKFTDLEDSYQDDKTAYEFDAVFEDTLELESELTGFPIELGARAVDHRIILPKRISLTVAVSNNELSIIPGVDELVTGVAGHLGGIASNIAGIGVGFLGGSAKTRGAAALEFLIKLRQDGTVFTVDVIDAQFKNMVIKSITRTKDPENEQTFYCTVNCQELTTLPTVKANNQPSKDQLNKGDPSQSQAAATVDSGEVQADRVSDSRYNADLPGGGWW